MAGEVELVREVPSSLVGPPSRSEKMMTVPSREGGRKAPGRWIVLRREAEWLTLLERASDWGGRPDL